MKSEQVVDNPQLTDPSRDELFRLLTEEIKDVAESAKVKGWTPWVVLASLASGLWVLAQDLLTTQHSRTSWVAVFLIVTMSLHILRFTHRGLDVLSEDRSGKVSFFFVHSEASAFGILMVSLWTAGTAYAVLYLLPLAVSRRLFITAATFYTLMAATLFLAMILVIARLPIPVERRGPGTLFELTADMIAIAISMALLLGIVRSGFVNNLTIVDVRIGAIVSLGAMGVIFLCKGLGSRGDSSVAISELRRDLVLGGISTTDGIRRARAILQGMWLSDVVLQDMIILLKLISAAKGEYDEAFAKMAIFNASIGLEPTSQAPDIGKLNLGNMLDTLEAHELRVCEIAERYHGLLASLRFRLEVVSKLYPRADADSRRLIAEVRTAQEPVDLLLKRFIAEYRELQQLWNLRYSSEPRDHEPFDRLPEEASVTPSMKWLWRTGDS
jgi:hypothetical protein